MQIFDASVNLLSTSLDIYQSANKLNRFLFKWVFPLVKSGRKAELNQNNLFTIREKDNAMNSYSKYIKEFRQDSLQMNLKVALFKAFRPKIIFTLIIYCVISLLSLVQPIITQKAQSFFIYEEIDKPSMRALITFASIQFVYFIVLSILRPILAFEQKLLSVKIQGATQTHMISKSLKFPLLRSSIYNSGELINMLQVDVTQAANYFTNVFAVYLVPVQLLISGIIFFLTLKEQALAGGLGALIQAGTGMIFGHIYGQIQNKFMKAKDLRMACVDEALLQVKQIKLNCLEGYFDQRIAHYRKDELKYLKYQVWMMIFLNLSQQIVQMIAFELTFFYSNQIDFAFYMVLTSNYITLLTILKTFPIQLKNYYTSLNSQSRLDTYFNQADLCQNHKQDYSDNALSISNGQFNWNTIENLDEDTFNINISLEVKKHKFIAIVGNAASGKSSILKSIIGEMNKLGSDYVINGSMSICSQEPWIISGSIQNNITYMQEFNQQRYNQVIKVCGLEHDLKSLADQVISEKGDNLSGGQRKRINLARTVYQDADIYLLDDPLSALDIKVQCQVYQQCLKGFLKDKTRILFANNFTNLQSVDYIYVIEDGKVIKQGTYQTIMKIDESKLDNMDYNFEEQHFTQEVTEYQNNNSLQTEDQQTGEISNKVKQDIFRYQGSWLGVGIVVTLILFGMGPLLYGNSKMADGNLTDEEFKEVSLKYYPMSIGGSTISLSLLMLYILLRGLKASKILHSELITSLMNASFTKFYNKILLGRLMNRLSKDIYNIDILFPTELNTFVVTAEFIILGIMTALLFLNIVVIPFLLLYLLIIILITRIYCRCLIEVTRIESVSKSPIFTYFQQIIRGITFVRSSLPSQQIIAIQTTNIDIDLSNQICLYGLQSWYQLYTGLLTAAFQIFLFIICFLMPSGTQNFTYGILTNLSTLSQQIMQLTLTQGNLLMYTVSFERCLHLAQNIESDTQNTTKQLIANKRIAIEMKGSTFKYRSDLGDVLSNINFQVYQGQKIGIVGRTGSGKSSLIMALTNMLEQVKGEILINEQSTRLIPNLRQYYSIIPQDPLIFTGSIKENLDPLQEYSDQQLNTIIELCQLKTEHIEIAGKNLSLGEKQLLSIARCLLHKKPIVLIDEATACIDSQTEEKIKNIFTKEFKNQTVLTIAHKVSTIMDSDKIMVINNGQITEFDDPKILLESPNSEFKQIVDLIKRSDQL